jgi:hypothetical protein
MKVFRFVCLSAAAALPQLALAAQPPGQVGAFQAIDDFCSKVDPAQHSAFSKEGNSLYAGLTQEQITALRASAEYQRGYKMLSAVLPELTNGDAYQGCQVISGSSRATPDEGWGKRDLR